MFQVGHTGVDNGFLPVGVLLVDIRSLEFLPVDVCPVEYPLVGGVEYFDLIGEIGAVDKGCVVPEP